MVQFNGEVTPQATLELALAQAGSVTSCLEQLVGEPVDACDRRHLMTRAGVGNLLGVAEGEALLQRSAELRGRTSAQPFMRAESILVPRRLPSSFFTQLETSNDPIGRILCREGIALTRCALPPPSQSGAMTFAGFQKPGEHLLARTYRLEDDAVAVMMITEWFLVGLEPFLKTR